MTINIQNMFLTPNEWSRPQIPLKKVKAVVLHWTANPKTTAIANRNFFESRKEGMKDYGSAHYIVGLEGEIIRCLPDTEMGYHVGSKTYNPEALKKLSSYPNDCTIGIEMCHIDWDGRFTEETLESTADLTAALLLKYGLTIDDITTHHWIVLWKDCPRWFVNNPNELVKFKQRVAEKMKPKEELKVLEKWQYDLGVSAVDALGKLHLLNDPDTWKKEDKLAQPVPTWLFFEMIRRLKENK